MAKGNFGERLKREREMREVSLTEVTAATRIGPRFLEALENEAWDKLPGGAFNRGFVRSVARYLGLDEESLLAEYDMARNNKPTATTTENRIPARSRWPAIVAVLVIIGIVVALIFAGRYAWRRYTSHGAKEVSSSESRAIPVQAASSASPTLVAQVTSAPVVSDVSASLSSPSRGPSPAALDLSVSTSAATRMRILGDGRLLLDSEVRAGENRHFPANERFEVTAADSSAVLLELNGQAMPPVGAPGASGTIVLSPKDLRQAPGGKSQP
jgi:cytoskeletal protein RodZ